MIMSALVMIYPLKTDLDPPSVPHMSNVFEIEVEEIDTVEDSVSTVFDPISVSVVQGSRSSLHRNYGQSSRNLHSTSKYSHSSHGLHRISKHCDSFETLEIQPRSSSFSVRRSSVYKGSHYSTLSPTDSQRD